MLMQFSVGMESHFFIHDFGGATGAVALNTCDVSFIVIGVQTAGVGVAVYRTG